MIKRILIPLDVLLDTRLGVMSTINKEAAERLVSTKEYWLRENDDWTTLTGGLVTTEQFKEAYANRGGDNSADTINASILTGISPFLMRILAEDHVNRMDNMGNPEDEIGLTINIWPYTLPGEVIDDLENIIQEIYGEEMPVEVVSHPLEELTPKFLDALYAMYITYDFHEWMHTHYLALSKVQMPCFNFIGPKLFERDVSKLTIEEKKFELFKFRVERLIHMDFEFIDAKYFSMIRPGDNGIEVDKDDIKAQG
ncbi:hypothetical protein [Pseudomonas phage PA1C]|uniref:Uncharacterized protein n=2 Tax=root TaxID=1 RepID=A0A5C1K8S5_9CAUD|nr:hypothetical protein PP933_gp172 [Pseudomonas phage vB_PaeM_PS119XW]QBX32328.1 hypothetical protein [Pseudomonas phage PA1C]QEM41901.1 hypothetical protein [Pseudomonas phage vB_PaeM_PS119XW]BEG72417.1 hypothetical protein RVBP21_0450 [Pseudomonas phage BRkr]